MNFSSVFFREFPPNVLSSGVFPQLTLIRIQNETQQKAFKYFGWIWGRLASSDSKLNIEGWKLMQFSNMGSHVWSEFACVFRLGSSGLKLKSPKFTIRKIKKWNCFIDRYWQLGFFGDVPGFSKLFRGVSFVILANPGDWRVTDVYFFSWPLNPLRPSATLTCSWVKLLKKNL